MNLSSCTPLVLLPVLALGLVACDERSTDVSPWPFDIVVSGDSAFGHKYAGKRFNAMLLLKESGNFLSWGREWVSDEELPVLFIFGDKIYEGHDYVLKFWVDSNFGGGRVGPCDPPDIDHQWQMEITDVSGDVNLHNISPPSPDDFEPVCDAFNAQLRWWEESGTEEDP